LIIKFDNKAVFYITTEKSDERLKIYKEAEEKYPKAHAPKVLPLNFLSGGYYL